MASLHLLVLGTSRPSGRISQSHMEAWLLQKEARVLQDDSMDAVYFKRGFHPKMLFKRAISRIKGYRNLASQIYLPFGDDRILLSSERHSASRPWPVENR